MVGSGCFPMKIKKRKELNLDEVNDDLYDLSLSSPARKIRRLNARLPSIMEEGEEQEAFAEMLSSSPVSEEMVSELQPPVLDPVNQERAIVLYKPVNSPVFLQSPSNVSVNLDSLNLVSGFKNDFLRASQSSHMKLLEEEENLHNKNATSDKSLAVIPWVPSQSQFPYTQGIDVSQFPYTQGIDVSQAEAPELMDSENEEVNMDIEDSNTSNIEQGQMYEYGGMRDEGIHQWPQQHCMIPQFPQNTSTPITWFK